MLHFGKSEHREAACTVDVAHLRDLEDQLRSYRNEDTELYRQIARMQSEHATALRREEEKGYERGLQGAQDEMTRLRAHLGSMCAWGETLAELQKWTLDSAASFWASHEAARHAIKGYPPALETLTCDCPPNCQGPDNTDKGCRAEDEQPEPFCKKHPNTAFADIGCSFCGTPPSVDRDTLKSAHTHTDECWEPDSGCDMGRSEAHAQKAREEDSFPDEDPSGYPIQVRHP